MKRIKYIIVGLIIVLSMPSCVKLDIAPMNIIQDDQIFGSESGIMSYMARIYGEMPVEDFRYGPEYLFNHFWVLRVVASQTGEALCREVGSAQNENTSTSYRNTWSDQYSLIRECNYFLETIDKYKANFSESQISQWKGEVYCIRAFTYYGLAKRYGGVPLVTKVLDPTSSTTEEMNLPRSSEESTWKQISADYDQAINLLPETTQEGRVNKYVAYGLKSRAMLYAGCVAKYNTTTLFDSNGNAQVCGMKSSLAKDFFQQAYDAAKAVDGHYSLYKGDWKAGDAEAQYTNFHNIFTSASNVEAMFSRLYKYPDDVHGYDAYNVPRQMMGANGYSAETNPTLDLVQMYEGLPKDADGNLDVYNADGTYKLYDKPMDLFANAEPRLRATVVFPGDELKGEEIEIWRGIYTGKDDALAGKINRLIPAKSTVTYENCDKKDLLVTSGNSAQTAYTLHNGTKMNPAGRSGRFSSDGTCALSGFSVRKWIDTTLSSEYVLEDHSTQPWIELRYAEVLLSRAEAAAELASLGDNSHLDDAYSCINQIRERAGASQLTTLEKSSADNFIQTVRKERRKELAFENKIWWDLKRWRVIDKEQNNRRWLTLMPFYSDYAGKWFFDVRYDERNNTFTFDTRWYYQEIPTEAISSSNNIVIQNPGY